MSGSAADNYSEKQRGTVQELPLGMTTAVGAGAKTQMGTGMQSNGKGLQEFDADIERLVLLAFPSATTELWEQLSVQAVVDGMKDVEVQNAIRIAASQSSKACLNIGELQVVSEAEKLRDITDGVGQLKEKFGKLSQRLVSKRNSRGNRSDDEWKFVLFKIPGSGSLLKGFCSVRPELGKGQCSNLDNDSRRFAVS
ncbi:hypothetical protein Trydic_g6202 [Trypoxylus dichotomus]